nr:kinesin-like protein KIN-4C [Ipomoea batatas]
MPLQVAELKKKQDAQSQLLRQKQKSDEAAKHLQDEIQRIKTQKVQLQQTIKQESERFRLWKASREKEVLQLKKEGRRNEYEMHKLLALNQRQKMVLQRKTEEAANATKRLKELLESRKTSREASSIGNSNGPGSQALLQAIEHELEVFVRVHEVRSEYERQMEERAKMAKEVADLKQSNISDSPQIMSPGARNSRIFALENMLATSSSALVSMASHLSEAEERERAFSGRGRWNQVRTLAEGKNIMNFLFNLASSSRCQLRDKEVECREKDSEIRELKEKVVNLVGQLESHKAEIIRKEQQIKVSTTTKYF